MAAAIILGFFLIAVLVVWATKLALWEDNPKRVRVLHHCCFAAAAVAAWFTTFHYVYYSNANTRFHGWPFPHVIFQRDSPTSPWLDFVGPTTLLSFPMNFLLYALIPSVAVIILAHRSRSQMPPKEA
jgi:hypothetical protein